MKNIEYDGDIKLNNLDNLSLCKDIYAVEQACKSAASTLLGEMIFNTDEGIPYFELAWGGKPNIRQLEFAIREAILKIEDVKSVKSLEVFVLNQKINYNIEIETTFGGISYGV